MVQRKENRLSPWLWGAGLFLLLLGCTPHLLPRESGQVVEEGARRFEGEEQVRVARFLRRGNPALEEGTALLYARYILEAGEAFELDPLLIAAVITVESRGVATAISPKGAVGLMQILPEVGEELARAQNLPWEGWNTLLDPKVNIWLGCAYLRLLLDRYQDTHAALGAYNIGPTLYDTKFLKKREPRKGLGPYVHRIQSLKQRWVEEELREAMRRERMDG